MAVTKPRNRVVLFRLTQDEYSSLQSAAGGARSISDFARARILGPTSEEVRPLVRVDEKLDQLQLAVDQLTRIIESAKASA